MSMVGTAATREGWPRSRILSAVLAVSLVLNVLFVAGAVWGRIEEAPARGLDRRFERIGAQLDLDRDAARRFRQAARRAARTRRQGSATGRTALSRGLGRGRKSGGRTRTRCFDCSTRLSTSGASSTARRRARNPRFPRDAVARAARPVCRPGARAGKLAEVAHIPAPPERNHFVPKSRSPASPRPGRI